MGIVMHFRILLQVNPCSDASYNTSTHLVLKSMSCAAQKYGIHVVVNTAEVEWCTPGAVSKDGQTCPSDGHFMVCLAALLYVHVCNTIVT